MDPEKDYIAKNRKAWNNKVATHLQSDFYDVPGFLKGNSSLQEIELGLLEDIAGKSVLHLQCHFGLDTLSLARLGADVTGVDLSDQAIQEARALAEKTGIPTRFVCCDLYDLPNHLDEQFDLVFTTYGTIGWLPDLNKWASLISRFLKPGGELLFVEFHPVVWMFNEDFTEVGYDYFNTQPIVETETGTYADPDSGLEQEFVAWNHSLGEVLGSLLSAGLEISFFQEYDYSPYNCFKGTVEVAPGRYRIGSLQHKIPMVYALKAKKQA
ncbi:MAG: class I SAM-dependent methyltransferase [Eudoraea sp.]|nr:class I SAM-dependent methyltransferase [Eudoraea sp.]